MTSVIKSEGTPPLQQLIAEPLGRRWSDQLLVLVDRYRAWALGVLLLAYCAGFSGQWRPEPDAALYVALGRNLADGKGYVYHDKLHHLAYPGWPWVLSGIFRLSGSHGMLMAHVAVFAMSLASLALMYRLMYLHAGRAVAVLMTLGLGISYTFYRYGFELRSDMPFMLGVMMVLAGYEGLIAPRREGNAARRRSVWDGLLLGAGLIVAVTTRPTMWALLGALGAAITWEVIRGRFGKKGILLLVIVPVAAVAFLLADPRRGGQSTHIGDYEDVVFEKISWPALKANVSELLDPMASEAVFGLDFGRMLRIGPVSLQAIGSVVAIFAGLLVFRERSLWGLWFLVTVLMMVFTLARDRYFLPVLPVMIYGWWLLIRQINLRVPGRLGNVLFALLFVLGAFPNSAKVGGFVIEQRHKNPLTAIRNGRFESVYRVADMIRKNVPEGTWVIAPKKFSRILTALSGRNVGEPGDVKGHEPDFTHFYLLEPAEFEPDSPLLPLIQSAGPEVAGIKGDYDEKRWALREAGGPR